MRHRLPHNADPSRSRTPNAVAAHSSATASLRGFRRIPRPVREELAQEATLRTLLARDVRDVVRFAGRVGHRLGIDWLRRTREVPLGEVEPPETASWSGQVEARLDLERVWAAVARAPGTHRDTLEKLYLAGLTLEELLDERLAACPTAERGREQSLLYKRRMRALGWLRRELA